MFHSPAPSPQLRPLPLAIVGASVRSAAASAVRAGFRPLAADLFADADLRAIATTTRISPYPEGLLDWLRSVEPAAWMYTGALENHPALVDQMAWIAPLWGNPEEVLTRARSPWELAGALASAGLLFPETRLSAEGLPNDGSWLTKSYRGASGSGVREWSRELGARSREQEYDAPRSQLRAPCCYQRRVAGTPSAAIFVAADGDARLLGVTRQLVGEAWLGAHGFQYAGSIGPAPVSDETLSAITRIGEVIAQQFELVGLFGVDMIVEANRVWTLEVNPRYTASVEIVERATGVHAVAAHGAACGSGLGTGHWGLEQPHTLNSKSSAPSPESLAPSALVHGKAILFAKRDVVIAKEFADSTLTEALRLPWPTLADISPAGAIIESGRPILTLFADGANCEEVERRLRERVATLEVALYAA
jgi:uncharacterized protein